MSKGRGKLVGGPLLQTTGRLLDAGARHQEPEVSADMRVRRQDTGGVLFARNGRRSKQSNGHRVRSESVRQVRVLGHRKYALPSRPPAINGGQSIACDPATIAGSVVRYFENPFKTYLILFRSKFSGSPNYINDRPVRLKKTREIRIGHQW